MSLFSLPGKCRVCGCTEDNPCYHPDYGTCAWADDEQTICTHCAIAEIAEDPETTHCINDEFKDMEGGEE